MKNLTTIIIGASSEIAKALAQQIITEQNSTLIVVSRHVDFYEQDAFSEAKLIALKSYDEQQIGLAVESIRQVMTTAVFQVYICNGVLHNKSCQPEKRLEDFSADAFTEIISANTTTPMLWLKYLLPLLSGKQTCKVVIFTARVGSISDNQLGGWYSYRASKAAINMLIKCTAIELARRAKNIKLISFHPGTTDSPLSKPFQKNVPKGKLFSSEYVAQQLLQIVANSEVDGEASFLDWQGKKIAW